MGKIICPSCRREIDDNIHFCPWCGTRVSQNVVAHSSYGDVRSAQIAEKKDENTSQWPDDEKSVSFTIYERDPNGDTNSIDDGLTEDTQVSNGGWRGKHIFLLVIMLLAIIGIVAVFSLHSDQYENHMPDYEKVVQKQSQQQQKREQKLENERREVQRIQEELKRAQEEAAAQEAARIAAESDAEEDEEILDEDALEERLQDIFESLGM